MLLRSFRGEGQAHTSKVVDALYWRAATGAAIAESDGSGNVLSEYVFFGGERIARRDGSGNVYFYYTDQVGSTVAMTDASRAAARALLQEQERGVRRLQIVSHIPRPRQDNSQPHVGPWTAMDGGFARVVHIPPGTDEETVRRICATP